jgi:hypothetical protein
VTVSAAPLVRAASTFLLAAQLTTDGHPTEYELPHPASGPTTGAIAPDGSIWFTEGGGNRIGRITPEGEVAEFKLPRPDTGPGDITAGADGNLWFLELDGRMDDRAVDGARRRDHRIRDSHSAQRGPRHTRRHDREIPARPQHAPHRPLRRQRPPIRSPTGFWYAAARSNKIGFLSFH